MLLLIQRSSSFLSKTVTELLLSLSQISCTLYLQNIPNIYSPCTYQIFILRQISILSQIFIHRLYKPVQWQLKWGYKLNSLLAFSCSGKIKISHIKFKDISLIRLWIAKTSKNQCQVMLDAAGQTLLRLCHLTPFLQIKQTPHKFNLPYHFSHTRKSLHWNPVAFNFAWEK